MEMDNSGFYSDSFRYWSKAVFTIFMGILQLVILKCYLKSLFFIKRHKKRLFLIYFFNFPLLKGTMALAPCLSLTHISGMYL